MTSTFTSTSYEGKTRTGKMVPDENGYYTVVVGALNSYNSAGEFYTAKGAEQLFDSSSSFMRRIESRALYAELGHPKMQPGMSGDDFYRRVMTIEEKNQCAHFCKVWLDYDFGKNHPELNAPDMIAIMAKVKPAGVHANVVQMAFENPLQNSAFSVRGITDNAYVGGRVERKFSSIITFDYVTEPGIKIADKFMAPGLESRAVTKELERLSIDNISLRRILTERQEIFGLESSDINIRKEILSILPKEVSRVSRTNNNRLRNW